MEEVKNTKTGILAQVAERLDIFTKQEREAKYLLIENKVFEFANFMEAQVSFMHTVGNTQIPMEEIIRKSLHIEKTIVLPVFTDTKNAFHLCKVTDYDRDLLLNAGDVLEPNPEKCKKVSLDDIDIAFIPGLAFDDKGGRIGFGNNYYTRLITKLPETCRKISLAFEEQIVDQIQMDSRKHTVDIIITDKRVIYKI
ncbi:MAG: 5-formyltetrahydrofolate cyclo-ligase [Desulfotignum sp.]|nr:5-formyltetrahydrofolate cyclo-ligase [Desulfotignum sp.]MCF8112468.1 5-formyltetrahydrofolate cyclo-ligase [Desulfotignum sp.]MCF8124843.1 5-formyltetrahydrofolate cyclo-ligase [Desulfotignum sp.]